jgi:hypothetical protein
MRAQIDTFINTAKHFTEHFGKRSREMSLTHTELQRAKHLLGLHLKMIGSENPYPNSMDSTNQIIDKETEHNDVTLFPTFANRNCDTDIKAVKEFRKILQDFLDNYGMVGLYDMNVPVHNYIITPYTMYYVTESFLAVQEAKCWLGWYLDAVREEEPFNEDKNNYIITQIASFCHEMNRIWCEANGDHSQKTWEEAEEWQKESAIAGVRFALNNPDAPISAQHDAWMADKIADGWVYGEIKDAEKKTHPCIVPFDELPVFQQKKDEIFRQTVESCIKRPIIYKKRQFYSYTEPYKPITEPLGTTDINTIPNMSEYLVSPVEQVLEPEPHPSNLATHQFLIRANELITKVNPKLQCFMWSTDPGIRNDGITPVHSITVFAEDIVSARKQAQEHVDWAMEGEPLISSRFDFAIDFINENIAIILKKEQIHDGE